MVKLLFCQSDSPVRGSFWQKDSLINHILFELWLIMIFSWQNAHRCYGWFLQNLGKDLIRTNIYTTVVVNFLPRMTFTNGVQCKTGMVVHHNNAGSNIGQSQGVTLYIPLTLPFSSVYSNCLFYYSALY